MALRSPTFSYRIKTGDLAAGGVFLKNYENSREAAAKHAPFNKLFVNNLSGQELEVHYGTDNYITLRANSNAIVKENGMRQFWIVNNSLIANDRAIEIQIKRDITLEDIEIAKYLKVSYESVISGEVW